MRGNRTNHLLLIVLTLLLFGLGLLVTTQGDNPNYCDQACIAERSGLVHGLAAMPPGNSQFVNARGWPMHVFYKTIDDDTQNGMYAGYSVVATVVDLLIAGVVAWTVIKIYKRVVHARR